MRTTDGAPGVRLPFPRTVSATKGNGGAVLVTYRQRVRRCVGPQPSAAITSAGACTSSISTPSPAIGNSSLLLGCKKVMS